MKVIISHDVDHISYWEHNKDLFVPKFLIRGFIEFSMGRITSTEIMGRLKSILNNKFHNIEMLMDYNTKNNIPATYFIGVANGKGLNYSLVDAEKWIKLLVRKGCGVGVHGITHDNPDKIRIEKEIFRDISGLGNYGIRMHCLCNSSDTLRLLDNAGYQYDSTLYKLENPFKIGNMWEFPLHIMDVDIIRKDARWQNQTLKQAIETTKNIIKEAYNKGIIYLTINFHDRFFTDNFKTWKEWYIWLVTYLRENNYAFTSYQEAIIELETYHS